MDCVADALANYLRSLAKGEARIIEPISWVSGEIRHGVEWHPFVSRGTTPPKESQEAVSLPTESYD